MTRKNSSASAGALAGFLLLALAASAAPQTAAPRTNRIGKFTLSNPNGTFDQKPVAKGTQYIFRGPRVYLTSARYDMSAPQIIIENQRKTKQNPDIVEGQNAEATGGVSVVVRSPEDQQTTTLTCDSARYVGTQPGANPRLYLTGKIHAVTRTPDLDPANPLVVDSQKGYVDILPEQKYSVHLDGMEGTGVLLEKPAKPAVPRPKKP